MALHFKHPASRQRGISSDEKRWSGGGVLLRLRQPDVRQRSRDGLWLSG